MTTSPQVLTFGETMGLADNRRSGTFMVNGDYRLSFGGAESNVAIALRRLGTEVHWVGRLGDDGAGDMIVRELRAERVRVTVSRDPHRPTGFMLKHRRSPFATSVTYYRRGSAASAMTGDDVTDNAIAESSLLHATGITPALSPDAREATLDVMRRARAAGVIVSFDLNHRRRLWDREHAAEFFREALPLADIIFAGLEEARILAPGSESAEALEILGSLGPSERVLKLGPEGAEAVIDGRSIRAAAMPVAVCDTVGAGDAFVAGYLADRLAGATPEQRLRTATDAGTFACTTAGDWESSPTREDLISMRRSEPVER